MGRATGAVVITWGLFACAARAQDGEIQRPPEEGAGQLSAPAPADETPAPDIVLLTNGGLVRGTISERTPGRPVTIAGADGTSYTFAWNEVRWAGPSRDMPSTLPAEPSEPYQPPAAVVGAIAHVTLRARQPELTFHVLSGSDARFARDRTRSRTSLGYTFTRLCSAPCGADLPVGSYALGVSHGVEVPVRIPHLIAIAGDSALTASYVDRAGVRDAGLWMVVVGGLIASVAPLFVFVESLVAVAIAGGIVGVGLLVAGMVCLVQSDDADIDVRPAT